MNSIAAVVVTYNRKELVRECIASILSQEEVICDIIVVDNNSTDGTEEFIKSFDSDRLYYRNTGKNLGGAGGFNYGIQQGAEMGYEYLWLMDDDCIPTKTALKELTQFKDKHPSFGFLSSKVLWKDGKVCLMNQQRLSMYRKLDVSSEEGATKIVMASFVSFFVPIRVVKKVGLPIKEFFIWTDDCEYSWRISRSFDCFFVGGSIVIHKTANNVAANIAADSLDRMSRYRYMYRNETFLYRREGVIGCVYLLLKLLLHSVRILTSKSNNPMGRLKIMIKGVAEGVRFNPNIEYVTGEAKKNNTACGR